MHFIYNCVLLFSLILIFALFYLTNNVSLFNKYQSYEEIPSNNDLLFKDYLKLEQNDTKLINYVKNNLLSPPPPKYAPYNFMERIRLPKLVRILLSKLNPRVSDGFFIEAGANDGIDATNTLWLEKYYGWNGLLVECNPEILPKLHSRQRKAYIADVCLSTSTKPQLATLNSLNGWTQSSSFNTNPDIYPKWNNISFSTYQVKQIPLYTLIAALERDFVDFISLDIQSLELKVLNNFPFDLIRVKAWLIEIGLLSEEDYNQLRELMKRNNYTRLIGTYNDEVYLHKYH